MGSGCSSPLRRFGKRGGNSSSTTHRDSDPYGIDVPDDQIDHKKSIIKTSHFTHKHEETHLQQQQAAEEDEEEEQDDDEKQQLHHHHHHEIVTPPNIKQQDQDNTATSKIIDDHPSTGSDCVAQQQNEAQSLKTATLSQNNYLPTRESSTTPSLTPLTPPIGNGTGNQAKQKIFTIKDDHRHVVVIYPETGLVSVWDIYEEVSVRTFTNIDHPRDLRMIDKQRAVILCNRELRVYDLNTGNMLTKLKGVMNQKMPFFEVFGDNYAIALARNRMYLNLLNLKTGELETTFKVGEDRFLNSLLVSASGSICVCGDETQKPFPLLVWNLNERRLMYDLRLDRHEFLTKYSAISDDGQIVVSACKQIVNFREYASPSPGEQQQQQAAHETIPNFIVIYDLSSGTLFKKLKPELDTCAVAIAYFPNRSGKLVVTAIVDSSIIVWDLMTGSEKHILTGHSAAPDIIQVQNAKLYSMDSTLCDQNIRVWDLIEGICLAVINPDAPISCCQMSIRGDALIWGFPSEIKLKTWFLSKNGSEPDVSKKNKRRKSSKSISIFDDPPSRKSSS